MAEKVKIFNHEQVIGSKMELGEIVLSDKDVSLYALGIGFSLGINLFKKIPSEQQTSNTQTKNLKILLLSQQSLLLCASKTIFLSWKQTTSFLSTKPISFFTLRKSATCFSPKFSLESGIAK